MTWQEYDSRQSLLGAGVAARLVRYPYLPLSLLAHATLFALLYYFGSYQGQMREREAEITSSLRATTIASTARRLQDLETIKQLLEKSANRVDPQSEEPRPELPETPEEMVEHARELSRAIDELDQEIRAEELAELLAAKDPPPEMQPPPEPEPPRESEPSPPISPTPTDASPAKTPVAEAEPILQPPRGSGLPTIDAESAASEVAALEAKARETLARRQMRLEARAAGVQIEGAAASGKNDTGDSAVRGQIANFIGSGDYGGQVAGLPPRGGAALDIAGGGDVVVPAVDANSLVPGRGRMLGAGGEYANRIYINSWYLIGPFQGGSWGRLRRNPVYPPESAVLLDAVYLGKDGRLLKWRYVTSQRYPLTPPDVAESAVYYGYTEVSVDEECDLVAWFGADDDAQVYVNDRVVWPGGSANLMRYLAAIWEPGSIHLRNYNLTEGQRVVHFNKGRNKIFFKLTNGAQGTHLSFILTRP